MSDTKSKAQMLADESDRLWEQLDPVDDWRPVMDEIAAELRRLDAVEAERDALASQKDLLIEAMRDEMDEGLRLREMGGAAPDENITAMTERVIRERDALRVEVERLRAAPAPVAQGEPVATLHTDGHWTHPPGRDPLGQFSGKAKLDVYAAPAPVAQPSPTAGMNIAQRILHVGGRNNAAGYIEFGSIQAVEALVRQVLRDLPADPATAPVLTPAQQHADELLAVLRRVDEFIRNGIEFGFIRMPDKDTPDTAHEVPKVVRAVLAKIEATGQEGGK